MRAWVILKRVAKADFQCSVLAFRRPQGVELQENGCERAHLPAFVTIISVPSWSNCRHSARPSSCTDTDAIFRASAASCGSSATAAAGSSFAASASSASASSASASECSRSPPALASASACASASSCATLRRVPLLLPPAAEAAEYAIADAEADAGVVAEAEAESESVCGAGDAEPLRWCEPLLPRGLPNEALFDGELHALFDGVLPLLGLFDELLLELIASSN